MNDPFSRGLEFAKNNPQIIYTLFLVFAIPFAFFYTSDRFLSVARDEGDRLERARVGVLADALVILDAVTDDTERELESVTELSRENETITAIDVIVATTTKEGAPYRRVLSLEDGTTSSAYFPDEAAGTLIPLSRGDPERSYALAYNHEDGRHWRSIRRLADVNGEERYVAIDISTAAADAVSERNIQRAYLVLLAIIALIVLLLARQARIIDYSRLYARLKEVDQMKDDFVSMAAHELRSPLTVIRGYVEMLGEGEGLSDAGKAHLKNIDTAAHRLNGLVGDILDVSKLQEGRMSFAPVRVDVDSILRSVVEGFVQPAKDKGLSLEYQGGAATLLVDPERFRQVAVNLVGNAVKYTERGEVRVSSKTSGSRYLLRVSDTGLGISAENQKRLFEKFYRVKTEATARIEGTGLGLWITKAMIEAMGGRISVESIEGKGSDFIVEFPLA